MNVGTDTYYGDLWDIMLPATAAMNQVWLAACNAVGKHPISGAAFWGGVRNLGAVGLKNDPGLAYSRRIAHSP